MSARDPRLQETAFPSDSHRSFDPDGGNKWPYSPGMSLRDYFAGQAINAVVSTQIAVDGIRNLDDASRWAAQAYRIADAMLRERSK